MCQGLQPSESRSRVGRETRNRERQENPRAELGLNHRNSPEHTRGSQLSTPYTESSSPTWSRTVLHPLAALRHRRHAGGPMQRFPPSSAIARRHRTHIPERPPHVILSFAPTVGSCSRGLQCGSRCRPPATPTRSRVPSAPARPTRAGRPALYACYTCATGHPRPARSACLPLHARKSSTQDLASRTEPRYAAVAVACSAAHVRPSLGGLCGDLGLARPRRRLGRRDGRLRSSERTGSGAQ